MYYLRHAEKYINEMFHMFGAALVTGARQNGKTTVIRACFPDLPFVTLDDPLQQHLAAENAMSFLRDHPAPVFIDEVQYAPNLFSGMKMEIDAAHKKGMYVMTGSQQFRLMKHVSESLAGRIGIQVLPGLSLREKNGVACDEAFFPSEGYFEARGKERTKISSADIWPEIWRGDLPELFADQSVSWERYYGAYLRTYVERDVRQLTQVGDEGKFLTFMKASAARTGGLLNLAELAREVGVSQPTADRWMSVLVASHIAYLLPSFHANLTKRAVRTPKLYFLNTGLAAYLTGWKTPEVLKDGAMSGAFFETFVISEIMKSYQNRGVPDLPFYYYRNSRKEEIDLIIEDAGVLYPLEIKKYADPKREDIRLFRVLDGIPGYARGAGGLICMYDALATLSGEDRVIPVQYL